MIPTVGNKVSVWKSVMGREYRAEGTIEQLQWDCANRWLILVANDWWVAENDVCNGFEIIPPVAPDDPVSSLAHGDDFEDLRMQCGEDILIEEGHTQ